MLAGNVTSTVTSGTASITNGGLAANPGQLDLGAATRTFSVDNGSAATDLLISAQIIGSVGLTKAGAGTLEIAYNNNTYTGATNVNEGTLIVNGSISTSVLTTVASSARLGGSGTVGPLTIQTNGTVAPGTTGSGILNVNGDYTQLGIYEAEIEGLVAGNSAGNHDRIDVTGNVNITGGSLNTMFSTFTPMNGDLIFILLNDGTDAITGTYAGYAQGAVVDTYGGYDWVISYNADSASNTFTGMPGGNDIALSATLIPEPNVAALIGSLGAILLLRRRR